MRKTRGFYTYSAIMFSTVTHDVLSVPLVITMLQFHESLLKNIDLAMTEEKTLELAAK